MVNWEEDVVGTQANESRQARPLVAAPEIPTGVLAVPRSSPRVAVSFQQSIHCN